MKDVSRQGQGSEPRRAATKRGVPPASLRLIYHRLLRVFGPQGWWPARSPFEVMVGAILTQATTWRNAERAIRQLRQANALQPRALLRARTPWLQRSIRPAGFFRQKAQRLRRLCRWLMSRADGDVKRLFRAPWQIVRQELLSLNGIGPETADAILLYAGQQPVFVVDAYALRVFRRHRLIPPRATYEQVQRLVMRQFPNEVKTYNEFHALLVEVGKRFCHRRHPECRRCPLSDLPHTVR